MLRFPAAVLVFMGIAAAQYVPLGTASDPCVGGLPWSPPQLRFGNFTCTVVASPGAYQVTLGLIEPYATTTAGSRTFNVSLNGVVPPTFQSIDIAALQTAPGDLVTRSAIVQTDASGALKLQAITLNRSAVISSITIFPAGSIGPPGPPGPQGPAGPPGKVTGGTCTAPPGTAPQLAVQLLDGTCLTIVPVNPTPVAAVPFCRFVQFDQTSAAQQGDYLTCDTVVWHGTDSSGNVCDLVQQQSTALCTLDGTWTLYAAFQYVRGAL
jgi:hypothetical protein